MSGSILFHHCSQKASVPALPYPLLVTDLSCSSQLSQWQCCTGRKPTTDKALYQTSQVILLPTASTCTSSSRMTDSSPTSLPSRGNFPSEQKWSATTELQRCAVLQVIVAPSSPTHAPTGSVLLLLQDPGDGSARFQPASITSCTTTSPSTPQPSTHCAGSTFILR